jgi:hypothetical protein
VTHVCGNTELLTAGGGLYKMPTNRPTWCLNATLPGIGADALHKALVESFANWQAVCDLAFIEVTDARTANIVIIDHEFDGPTGILADAMLPTGVRQQVLRLDRSERWIIADNIPTNRIELRTVGRHEIGHIIGFSHLPSGPPPDRMEARYSPTVNVPQATEIAMARKLYGPPASTPVDPTKPGAKPVNVTVEQDGKRWSGSLQRVA